MIFFIFPVLFFLAFLANGGKTYAILCIAAFLNVALYQFTTEHSVMTEALLDALTLIALISLGDKHLWWQIGWLLVAMILHLQFEVDQVNGTDLILSNYGIAITGITIMQLLGGFYGACNQLSERIWENNQHKRVHTGGRYLSETKTWRKE